VPLWFRAGKTLRAALARRGDRPQVGNGTAQNGNGNIIGGIL
jgi:hypothetical protein